MSKSSHSTNHRRGAALYITVLFTAMIVSLLALSSLQLSRIELEKTQHLRSRIQSDAYAESAIALALKRIAADPDWRTNFANGVESSSHILGGTEPGTMSWKLEDTDGSLTNEDQHLSLFGIGRLGGAVSVIQTQLDSAPLGFEALQCAAYSTGAINVSSNVEAKDGPIGTAASLSNTADIKGDVEANMVFNTGNINGTVTQAAPPREMPPSSVYSSLISDSVAMPYASIPGGTIDRELICWGVNPYGPHNLKQIYHIVVPAGQKLTIQDTRILGCLLIQLGNNAELEITEGNIWEPPNGVNLPSMICKATGNATILIERTQEYLKEDDLNKNFNPFLVPYLGSQDSDQDDEHKSILNGLFHIIGSQTATEIGEKLKLTGAVITEGSLILGNDSKITYDETLFTNPPTGYNSGDGAMSVTPQSWQPAAL